MRITENRLRSVIKSVIKESFERENHKESHKQSLIEKYTKAENRDYWIKYLKNDFHDMSVGDSVANEIKSMYYPRWEKEDFKEVIEAIDESLDKSYGYDDESHGYYDKIADY